MDPAQPRRTRDGDLDDRRQHSSDRYSGRLLPPSTLHYSLFTVYCLPFTHHSPLCHRESRPRRDVAIPFPSTIHHSPFTIHCLPFTLHPSLITLPSQLPPCHRESRHIPLLSSRAPTYPPFVIASPEASPLCHRESRRSRDVAIPSLPPFTVYCSPFTIHSPLQPDIFPLTESRRSCYPVLEQLC